MPRRIDAGDVLAAVGALLVLVALFLAWFGEQTAWEAFESLDLVLAGLALGVLAAAATGAGLLRAPSPRVIAPLGALLVVVVAVQLVEPPPGSSDGDTDTGAWLALAGSALVLLGGALRIASVSVSVSVGSRDVRRRVPAVDRRTSADLAAPGPAAPPAPGTPAPGHDAVFADAPAAPAADPGATQPFSDVDGR